MRPRGDISAALLPVFERMAPCGWRDVLPAAPVDVRSPAEVRMVRYTVENMVRRGQLVFVGKTKDAGSRVWRDLYEPAMADELEEQTNADSMRDECLRAIGVVVGNWKG